MKVVSKKKRRRPMRPSFARGAKIVKVKPMATDELMRLLEKGQRETDPEKIDRLVEQFMEGFYGEKLAPV